MDAPDEPLEISAPLAWRFAENHCNRDTASGESCAWNHGLWQFLRIMKLAGSASGRGSFYRRAVRSVLERNTSASILVSGTADYAMLAQILHETELLGATPSVTVVDLCETPLFLNRWYADHRNTKINTLRVDILEFRAPAQFDLICTDAFLGRFPPDMLLTLAVRWQALLKPGGKVVTANRLRPGTGPEEEYFSPQQAESFRAAVARTVAEMRIAPPLVPADLQQAAAHYATRHKTYPVRSAEDVRRALLDAGLAIDQLEVVAGSIPKGNEVSGPSVPSGKGYLYVAARRPDPASIPTSGHHAT